MDKRVFFLGLFFVQSVVWGGIGAESLRLKATCPWYVLTTRKLGYGLMLVGLVGTGLSVWDMVAKAKERKKREAQKITPAEEAALDRAARMRIVRTILVGGLSLIIGGATYLLPNKYFTRPRLPLYRAEDGTLAVQNPLPLEHFKETLDFACARIRLDNAVALLTPEWTEPWRKAHLAARNAASKQGLYSEGAYLGECWRGAAGEPQQYVYNHHRAQMLLQRFSNAKLPSVAVVTDPAFCRLLDQYRLLLAEAVAVSGATEGAEFALHHAMQRVLVAIRKALLAVVDRQQPAGQVQRGGHAVMTARLEKIRHDLAPERVIELAALYANAARA